MDRVIDLIFCAFVVLGFAAGVMLGSQLRTGTPVESKRKIHLPRARVNDLLDPVTPAEQRLEKSLEAKEVE